MFLECPTCNIGFESTLLSEYSLNNPDDPLEGTRFTFSKCPKCEYPIITQQQLEFDGVYINWSNAQILYPKTDFHINPVIPDELKPSLVEAVQCYRAKSHTATTIMCRRILEGFCRLKGVKEKNLSLSINKLKNEGVINEQLFEWAHELRLIGNEAAHNIEINFSNTDAKDALDFTIAILDFTYSFKDKFDRFKHRRLSNKQT